MKVIMVPVKCRRGIGSDANLKVSIVFGGKNVLGDLGNNTFPGLLGTES